MGTGLFVTIVAVFQHRVTEQNALQNKDLRWTTALKLLWYLGIFPYICPPKYLFNEI